MKNIYNLILFSLILVSAKSTNGATVVRGPYLNMATQTSVHVRWRTSTATNSIVQYGTVDGSLTLNVTDNALVTNHDVTVSGLSADIRYFYSIGASNPSMETYASGSKYFFNTLPLKGTERTTRIWALGDCGNNSSNQINVRNQYMKYIGTNHTDLLLLLGDNAYDAGMDNEYQTNFYPIYEDSVLRNVVVWPSPGNHDYANNGSRQNDHAISYYDMFTLPTNGESGGVPSGTEAYYSFDYGNIHFLSLDSYGKDSNMYYMYDTNGPQVRWIKQDLAANTQKWTIAFWHHPPFTMGSHNSETESDLINIRFRFIRILERYGVDLVLNGHSHVYERSYFLNGYYSSEAAFNLATHSLSSSSAKYDSSANSCPYIKGPLQKKGTVYVVAGSAGQMGGNPLNIAYPHNAMVYSNKDIGGGLALTVQGNRLDAEWVCNDGAIRDRFTMMKDVNKKQTYIIPQGDSVMLSSSWIGSHQWTGGSTSDSISFVGSSSKTDTIIVKDNFSCLKDSFIVKKSAVTGLLQHKISENIKVAPNPSNSGIFNVDYFSSKNKTASVKVYDLSGKMIY
ncbi:MAG: acid phosphatase, partial [Bacteroidota bacterium]|nr:acid phosphatase [Bacteroidota bacterium]